MAEQALLCPSCQKRFKARSYDAGKTYKCPQCKGKLESTSQVDASAQTIVTDGPDAQSAVDPLIGAQIGQYKILAKLGEGGMGAVYKAEHVKLRRLSALKILPQHMVEQSPRAVKRFMREARSAAALSHPNIVTVYNVDEADGYHFIDMELVEGESVQDRLKRDGRFDAEEATRIVGATAQALAAAHEKHIVHRDIKPANILLDGHGSSAGVPSGAERGPTVKVADFGLAKNIEDDSMLTGQGQIGMGTAHFMSPEQCDGEDVDGRTDIYSLGATYYYLLTGNPPFNSTSRLSIMVKHKTEPVPDPREIVHDLPESVCRIIQKAMAKKPEERHQTCEEMIAGLESVSGEKPQHAALPASQSVRSNASMQKFVAHKGLIAAAGGLALLFLVVALFARRGREDTAAPPAPADPEVNTLYVAASGDDAWPGTLPEADQAKANGPLASLERAKGMIRAMKRKRGLPDGGITVYVREGTYPLTQTFSMTDKDSGIATAPVVYRAYENEDVRIIGGNKIAGFVPVQDQNALRKIDPACRGNVVQTDLRSQGILDFGTIEPRCQGRTVYPAPLELFFEDRPMQLARWPNDGWANIAGVPAGKTGGRFKYEGDRPSRWAMAPDVWLHGHWFHEWADSYVKVRNIDTVGREIVTCEPHGVYGYSTKGRYYALNLLEELDEPGEWYLDRRSGILYFWPPSPLDRSKAYASTQGALVRMNNVSHVSFHGLTFEITRATAIEVIGGTGNRIARCTLRNIGNVAVSIQGGTGHEVIGCHIHHTGDGGIRVGGGNRLTLEEGKHRVHNNHIHHYSRWCRTYSPAVVVSGVGIHVSHNLIHDAPHMAVSLSGNEHCIEFNEIHHVCCDTNDAGAVYMNRDWTERGNVVRHNYFHHISSPRGSSVWALYFDEHASGTTVFGNVFHKVTEGVNIVGRDHTVENNIFVDCGSAVRISWLRGTQLEAMLRQKLDAVNHQIPPYSTRYPKLATILGDEPGAPKGNVMRRNVVSGGTPLALGRGVSTDWILDTDNLVQTHPDFVDEANQNFQLKPESPAYALGFERIPMEKIGVLGDDGKPTTSAGGPSQSVAPSARKQTEMPPGFDKAFMLPDSDKDQYGSPVVARDGRKSDPDTSHSYEIWLKEPRMEFVLVPAGEFMMGSHTTAEETVRRYGGKLDVAQREHPQHLARITKPFYLAKYELTQQQWHQVMGAKPWVAEKFVQENVLHPAVWISWDDSQQFLTKLRGAMGGQIFRIPTEAEWEYACRSGTTSEFCFGDDGGDLTSHAWCRYNAWDVGAKHAQAVGAKKPNAWGLRDMHGNVWEWCQDRYGEYVGATQIDSSGPATGSRRVVRGGGIAPDGDRAGCRSASRTHMPCDKPSFDIGIRLAVSLVGSDTDGPERLVPEPQDPTEDRRKQESAEPMAPKLPPGFAAAFMLPDSDKDQYGDPVHERDGIKIDPETGYPYEIWLKMPGSKDAPYGVMEFVFVPAGEFMMGSSLSAEEVARRYGAEAKYFTNEHPQHKTLITKPFFMGKYETTRAQWDSIMGVRTRSIRNGDDRNPRVAAELIHRTEWERFPGKLGQAAGCVGFRLPTEAEWEYACRAGATSAFSFGNDEAHLARYAWFARNAGAGTLAVGLKLPNAWGMYDVHGNVWEWCSDWYGPYTGGGQTDPKGPMTGSRRVNRGGGQGCPGRFCRSACRGRYTAHDVIGVGIGARIALSLPKAETPRTPPTSPLSKLVSINFTKTPITQALSSLEEDHAIRFLVRFDPAKLPCLEKPITLNVTNMELGMGLRLILGATGLSCQAHSADVHIIERDQREVKSQVVADFAAGVHKRWAVQKWSDSSLAGRAAVTQSGARKILRVTYQGDAQSGWLNKKVALSARQNLDLSPWSHVLIKLRNTSDQDLRLAFAVFTGQGLHHETPLEFIRPGPWTWVAYDLHARNYKSESTNWRPTGSIVSPRSAHAMCVLIYPKSTGTLDIDCIELISTPARP